AVSEMLELEGFRVTTFTDPNLGLKSLKANSHSVVLCDVRMPKVDGLTLLSSIQHRAADVPVLLMSGHGDIPMAIEAMKLGAFDFLEKPLNASELVEKLDLALAQCQHNSPKISGDDQETDLP
ncbi:response regulator, partial [Vibrio sp. 10N.222.54.F6]